MKDEEVFQVDIGDGFRPFRHRIDFAACREADILPLIANLSFIKNKTSWGYVFRFGVLEIPEEDFELIARQMVPGGIR